MSYSNPSIQASGATFANFCSGVSGHLELLITANKNGTLAPTTAPTVSVTGGGVSGGQLAAGVYFLSITESNGIGETTAKETASSFTVAAGNIPQVTFPTLKLGNVSRNVYLTLVGGASGTETLYATGITAGTFNLSYAHPAITVPAPSAAPTVATGTTSGGQLLAGNYKVVNTEIDGAGESLASAESSQFTVSAQAAPTGTPTVNVTGSGGTLPAGVYFGKFTYVDSNLGPFGPDGETLAGTEFTFTQTSGSEPVITINDGGLPAWAAYRNLYLTQPGGSSGSETLAFTAITGTTYTITVAPIAPEPAPTGTPTVSVTGSGGTLPVGTYFGKITYTGPDESKPSQFGETLAGTEFTFTQTSGSQPVITFNDGGLPAWANGRRLYLTAAGGSSGSETLAAAGITGTTYTLTQAPPVFDDAPITPPTVATLIPPGSIGLPVTNTSSTNQPVVTPAALQAGNTARNYYLTPAGGAGGSEVLYATGSSASTFTLTGPNPPAGAVVPPQVGQPSMQAQAVPSVNTTGLSYTDEHGVTQDRKYQLLRAVERGNLQQVWDKLRRTQTTYAQGDPVEQRAAVQVWHDCHTVFAALAQLCAEGGTIIDANPGHLNPSVPTAIGGMKAKRQWPIPI